MNEIKKLVVMINDKLNKKKYWYNKQLLDIIINSIIF